MKMKTDFQAPVFSRQPSAKPDTEHHLDSTLYNPRIFGTPRVINSSFDNHKEKVHTVMGWWAGNKKDLHNFYFLCFCGGLKKIINFNILEVG